MSMTNEYPNPCCRCGFCCISTICPVAKSLGAEYPCPYLSFEGDISTCRLVVEGFNEIYLITLVCREPQRLAEGFAKLVAARNERLRTVAAELHSQAEGEVGRLRSLGWTQADFARALRELLETRGTE